MLRILDVKKRNIIRSLENKNRIIDMEPTILFCSSIVENVRQ